MSLRSRIRRTQSANSVPDNPDHQDAQDPDVELPDAAPAMQILVDAQLVTLAMQQVDLFHGKPAAKVAEFLDQLRYAFEFSPVGAKSDEEKISHAISRFRGEASEWVKPYRTMDPRPAWLSDFDLFAAELTSRFSPPKRAHNASARLHTLKQTGSVATYATEFLQGAAALKWPDPPLMDLFYRGLKDAVKDALVSTPEPTDLDSYIRLATSIDNRLQERVMERPRAARPTYPTPTPSRGSAPATTKGPATSPQERGATQPKSRSLPEEEKERRRKDNLCLYCASPDHIVRNCPLCPSDRYRPARIAEVVPAPDDLQGNDPAQQS
jgi:hypothetical protein